MENQVTHPIPQENETPERTFDERNIAQAASPATGDPLEISEEPTLEIPPELMQLLGGHAEALTDPMLYDGQEESFETLVKLNERWEDIRSKLACVYRLLLKTRTVRAAVESVLEQLAVQFDLSAARIILREDHPIASFLDWDPPEGASFTDTDSINDLVPESVRVRIVTRLRSDIGWKSFGNDAFFLGSAAFARLRADGSELGLLCLGSPDPDRYTEGMDTELIEQLADTIALGLGNAGDHERESKGHIDAGPEGILSEVMFREILRFEFYRAWRYSRPFSVVAIEWGNGLSDSDRPDAPVLSHLRRALRAADIIARPSLSSVWILMPETGAESAKEAASRIKDLLHDHTALELKAGVCEFSTSVPIPWDMVSTAVEALEHAWLSDEDVVILRSRAEAASDGEPIGLAP